MNLLKVWHKAKELIKEQESFLASKHRIEKATLDYVAIQNLINAASNSINPIEIHISTVDGVNIVLKPTNSPNLSKSFREHFDELHKNN